MGTLTNKTPGTPDFTYLGLLHLEANTEITSLLQKIQDGGGNNTGLEVSTTALKYTGNLTLASLTASTLVYLDSSKKIVSLAAGTDGQVLQLASGVPSWVTPSSGITIDTTPITGGGSGRILFESATGKVSESAVLSYIGGNVGIGTSAPLFPVDVTGGTGDNDIAAEFTAGAYSRGLMIGAYNSEGAIYSFNTRGTPGSRVLRVDGGGSNVYFGPSNEIKASGGKVGVGNTGTLSAKFHVLDTTEQLRIGYDASNYFSTTVGSTGSVTFALTGTTPGFTFSQKVLFDAPVRLKGYTVATLPTGVTGYCAYVTDALAPVSLATVVGGGAVTVKVFYDGANWIVQ